MDVELFQDISKLTKKQELISFTVANCFFLIWACPFSPTGTCKVMIHNNIWYNI